MTTDLLSLVTMWITVGIIVAAWLVAFLLKYVVFGSGPNPFEKDTREPLKPLVTDKKVKNKVLKQGRLKGIVTGGVATRFHRAERDLSFRKIIVLIVGLGKQKKLFIRLKCMLHTPGALITLPNAGCVSLDSQMAYHVIMLVSSL